MPRERRQVVQSNAAMYVGYADDDEDVDSIMKKFKALEEIQKRSGNADGDESALDTTQLVNAVGLRVGCGVDYSMDGDNNGQQGGGARQRGKAPRGEHVQTGEVVVVERHVQPEELDAKDGEDALHRLHAGAGYVPNSQRKEELTQEAPPLVPLELDTDVVMVELEGIESRTREVLFDALHNTTADDDVKHKFLDSVTRATRVLASRKVPLHERGLKRATEFVVEQAVEGSKQGSKENQNQRKAELELAKRCAAAVAKVLQKDAKHQLATKSKGLGLICVRPGGIPRGTYLGAYMGELYPGWRWFEKETAAQLVRRDVRRDDEVPVFYNAIVERGVGDPRGYDALFIDGAVKGSLLTRASHSCDPNARMRVRVRNGAYAVEMVTTANVEVGDEICWDYACRTDSEQEMRRALCLCGTRKCRNSYLHYTGETTYSAPYLQKKGTVAHFTAALLRACGPCGDGREGGGERDGGDEKNAESLIHERAAKAGIKIGTKHEPGVLHGLPPWLQRYAAACVEFVEAEKNALTVFLTKTFTDEAVAAAAAVAVAASKKEGSEETAEENDEIAEVSESDAIARSALHDAKAEAEGVASGRLQSLVVTLDKTRHVLGVTLGGADKVRTAPPPLVALDDASSAAHLGATFRRVAAAARVLGVDAPDALTMVTAEDLATKSKHLCDLIRSRHELALLAGRLREMSRDTDAYATRTDLPGETTRGLRACADLCDLASVTRTFFKAAPTKQFESPFVQVGAYGGDAGCVRRASYGPWSVWAFLTTWHEEYLEGSEVRLCLETRGVVRPPRPDAVLRKSALTGVSATSHGNVATLSAQNSNQKKKTASDESIRGSDGVFGSPIFDDVLSGVSVPGVDAAHRLVQRRAMSKQSEPCSDDAALSAPNAVPAWSGNQTNNGYAFVTSTGVLCVAKAVDGNVGADASDELRKTTGDAKPVTLRDTGKAEKTTPAADPVAAARTSLATVQAGLAAGLGNHHVEKNSDDFANQNKSPKEHPPAPKYGGSFDTDVPCLGCGALGVDGSFLLCNGCPAGGHLDCLGMRCAPLGNRWECDSCEGGRLAGIRPPGRLGFERAAAAAALAGKIAGFGTANNANAGTSGGVPGMSVVPGAISNVPSVGPLAIHHLASFVVVDFVVGAAKTETEERENEEAYGAEAATNAAGDALAGDELPTSGTAGTALVTKKRNAREAFLDESQSGGAGVTSGGAVVTSTAGTNNTNTTAGFGFSEVAASPATKKRNFLKTLTANDASFPIPHSTQVNVLVECGGALGEFRVLEGLVHCFCRGCQAACEVGLQPTNVFGLQAFEFHGGKGSAGKWKASIKAYPNGFPIELLNLAPGEEPNLGRDVGEMLGHWLEREVPEHPVLSRSRPAKE